MNIVLIVLGIVLGSILGISIVFLIQVSYSYFPRKIKKYQNVLVLGAKLNKNDKVTDILKNRLNLGVELLAPNGKILVSGSNIHSISKPEAIAMQEYLLEQGIEKSKIIVEPLANNTYQNLIRSKPLLTSDNVAIATSKYHVARVKIETFKTRFRADVYGADADISYKKTLKKELLAILWKNRTFFYILLLILSILVITIVVM